ncbi:MAG: EAL domain-containing protein [Gammaproteobacteria bacterium]|nr:EAL domain-containing protein [Gammaproteobacteria bacterium]
MDFARRVGLRNPWWLHSLGLMLACTIFTADVLLPPGAGVPILYLLVILAYAASGRPAWLATATAVCGSLIVAGFLVGVMAAPADSPLPAINRGLTLVALLVTAELLWSRMRGHHKLRVLAEEIEDIEARSRGVQELASDGIVTIDGGGRIVSVNAAAERMFGYEPGELLGRNVTDLMPEELQARHADYTGNFVRSREPRDAGAGREVEGRKKDGSLFWMSLSASEIAVRDGRLFTGILRDLSEQRTITAAMRASEARFRVMFEASPIGLVLCEVDGRIRQANDAFLELIGYSNDEALALNFWDLIADQDDLSRTQTERSVRVSRLRTSHEKELIRKHHGSVPVLLNGVIVEGTDGEERVWFTVESHAELKQAQQKLLRLSLYDDLTGLANRKLFRDNVVKSLAHARREQTRLALLYLDLDGFKPVNDTLGHDAGDKLLRMVANRLKSTLRVDDFIGRLGGDEFAVLIEDVGSPDDAANVADKIIDTLAQPFNINGHQVHVGTSIGIAIGPANGADAAALARFADVAMYKAKDRGGSRYQFYSDSLHAEVARRADMEVDLRDAQKKGQFTLRYQPQLDLDSDRLVAFEALLHWEHPERGLVPAVEFMPLLEQFGMIGAVGDWLLEKSCAELRRWLGLRDGGDLRLAVNVSAVQLADVTFAERALAILDAAGIEPFRLEVGVAERALMQDDKRLVSTLRELQEHGVGIAIDGFGTAGSSLIHLKQLPPVKTLKIDRSFIADVPGNAGDRAIVTATIALAHGVGLKVTAEGVETEWQKRFLKQAGCDFAQGRHFWQPLDGDAVAELLTIHGIDAARELEHAG